MEPVWRFIYKKKKFIEIKFVDIYSFAVKPPGYACPDAGRTSKRDRCRADARSAPARAVRNRYEIFVGSQEQVWTPGTLHLHSFRRFPRYTGTSAATALVDSALRQSLRYSPVKREIRRELSDASRWDNSTLRY